MHGSLIDWSSGLVAHVTRDDAINSKQIAIWFFTTEIGKRAGATE